MDTKYKFFFICCFMIIVNGQVQDSSQEEENKQEGNQAEVNNKETVDGILIGGLFEDDNDAMAKAFEAAVNYVNENDLIPEKKLIAEVQLVSKYDSFDVQKKVCQLLKKGVAAVFGPRSADTASHIQSLCDALELPHITTRWDLFQGRSSCLVNLYPHPTALSQALRDIVEAWDWKGFTVLYDDYDALRQIHGLLKLADDKGYLVVARQLKPLDGSFRKILKQIKHSGEKNIVIDCSAEILHDVLLQAQQVGLMGSDYSYIISTLDFHTIDYSTFMWSGTNMTSLRLVNPDNPYVQEIVKLWASNESSESTEKSVVSEQETQGKEDNNDDTDHTYSSKSRRSYIFEGRIRRQGTFTQNDEAATNNDNESVNSEVTEETPSTSTDISATEAPSEGELPPVTVDAALIHDAVILFAMAMQHLGPVDAKPIDCEGDSNLQFGYSVINFMKLSEIQGMTGVVKFDHEGFRTDFELEIIELKEEGISRKGIWNKTLLIEHEESKVNSSDPGEDLRNTTFIVLIALTHPYNMLKEDSKTLKGNDRYEGFGIDLIKELSSMMGFNYTFVEWPDKSSGNPTEYPNGTRVWNGMIGQVLSRQADLAIADITITRERERDVDFTNPFMNLGISILHRKPKKAPPNLFSFLSPFSGEVWAYVMSAYIGVSLLIFVMARISPGEWRNPYPCIEEPEVLENQFSLNNSFWFTVGSLMQQGSDIAPIAISTRMAASIWWFFTLIMVSSYTANLAAFLTIEDLITPFSDINELANQNEIKYGAKLNGTTANFFRDSSDPIHQKIWNFMKANPDCMMGSNDAGVKRVLEETNYAFFMESTSIDYEVERKCNLTQVGGLLDNKGYGIVMRQNSSYRNSFNKNVVLLLEKGKLSQLYDKWWKEKRGGGACSGEAEAAEAEELNLQNVGGVYYVLLGGCGISMFITTLELLWDVYTRDSKRQFKEELKHELKFIMKCSGTVKPIHEDSEDEDSKSSKHSSHSSSMFG